MQFSMKHWSWLAAVAGLAIYAGNAKAQIPFNPYDEMYEMTNPPDTVAGTVNGHVLAVGSGGSGSTFSGGVMHFEDNSTTGGNLGYYLPPSDSLLGGSSSFIADFRIRILADTQPASGRVMSFKSDGNGRGLHMDTNGVSFVSGVGMVGSASSYDLFTQFTVCRVVIDGPLNTAFLYVSADGDLNNGNGDEILLASAPMGGIGFAQELGAIGFAIGSLSGNGTSQAQFDLDWFRVASEVPEPATLVLLALGGIPMMIRRRRAS